ncbi:Endonuclease/exonuclease/phosphatase-like protein [Dissoconium aciculare CBS 342.82]|uniref:Endonuclease/exonuclease/phosphatase-like protein n=1 Tax=Dissoconium aciculare CBS 342.82 TaxID=1314786 RepID=A0A6J3MHW0_9PEZI|nr:Endonuclease/exonuclease/phosphatase-like protein [Dissoconium aciculare CBS 342.82]KAF1827473.1 Endonuclease/exonuclease/phosphatase-like protein [Dissoconium aciculare CBS 342.82]
MFSSWTTALAACVFLASGASAQVSIAEINGNRFLSSYQGRNVVGVRGLVTAKGPNGFWLRSTAPDGDDRTSESIYVFNRAALRNVTVGNIITLNGRVSEYRSSAAYLYSTQIESPSNIVTISVNNTVTPLVIGQDTGLPPTEQYTSLDNGAVFGVPGNQSRISAVNPILSPADYGLDFWESLSGELVTVSQPHAINRPNNFGDTWVVGNWPTTGKNARGGLTVTAGDANPEAIIIGSPLDGSANPRDTKLGDELDEITGVVANVFGFYYILPLTKITVTRANYPQSPPPTTLVSDGACGGITLGQYNIENFSPQSTTINAIARQIVDYLKTPDILFVQEVQDNNGPTDNGVVDANVTLSTLIDAISNAGSPVRYAFTQINPVNKQDGGQPGGNIRTAYLFNPAVVRLRKPNPGSSTDATRVLAGPSLSFNPGRIEPANSAWTNSRKPLVAQWETLDGANPFFTVNVHWTSKGGSSSIQGDARPPVNGGVDSRTAQANVTGTFIQQILRLDPQAAIVTAGDFNEFTFVQPLQTFASVSGLRSLDEVVGTPDAEVYTYLFDMNTQELDHMYVSDRIAQGGAAAFEHVHVNTWAAPADEISDHDPSVAKLNVCQAA